MLRGALAELSDEDADQWTTEALTSELIQAEVHQAISVSAWPSLCELLGRLPDCVTPAELQEALWQQSFVENPTHAPDHRNYRRFALLAAQMVAIGVELESDKVSLLVQHTLDLDRPWRERRDMLSGILSAASVEDRHEVVRHLDRRFEEHADIDDFEIVCGIAEHIGIEIPRDGAIRRCALRRWALDPKRGGALPVARLIDFVDMDATIGEEVATNLRQKGRVADAALLLSRLPQSQLSSASGDSVGMLDVNSGDAELARLRELLSMDDDLGANSSSDREGKGVFGPIEEGGAFRLPLRRHECVGYAETADAAEEAAKRLESAEVLAIGIWKEEAPLWHAPATLLALCSEHQIELIDLPALRRDESGLWPAASNRLRALLSNPHILKLHYQEDAPHIFAYSLGLGIATTLKQGERDLLGPSLDMHGLMASVLSRAPEDLDCTWSLIARRYLGLRLCPEESGSNWGRRPLRESQLHHAAAEAWTQLPILRALCAYRLVSMPLLRRHLTVQEKLRVAIARKGGPKAHVVGQLAPPGRLAWTDPGLAPTGTAATPAALGVGRAAADAAVVAAVAAASEAQPAEELAQLTRIAELINGLQEDPRRDWPALPRGALVEVFEERFGGLAHIAPLSANRCHGHAGELRRIPVGMLQPRNGWELPSWVASLPRPEASLDESLPPEADADAEELSAAPPKQAASSAALSGGGMAQRCFVADVPSEAAQRDTQVLLSSLFDTEAAGRLLTKMYDVQRERC